MIEGIRIALDIAAQPALRAHIKAPNFVPSSRSETDVWDYIRQYASTIYHPASTCAIGPVVDSALRVHGVEGLRVVREGLAPTDLVVLAGLATLRPDSVIKPHVIRLKPRAPDTSPTPPPNIAPPSAEATPAGPH